VTLSNLVNNSSAALVSAPPTCDGATPPRPALTAAPLPCCSTAQQEACAPAPAACLWCHAISFNVLTLAVSTNLTSWRVAGAPVLHDDTGVPAWASELFTGLQYVDWQFDGGDLIALVRAAYRGANAYHNSNRVLFTRVAGWRARL
jgi:hypothetical protein